jgi:molybdopterin synthase catalytic subunit
MAAAALIHQFPAIDKRHYESGQQTGELDLNLDLHTFPLHTHAHTMTTEEASLPAHLDPSTYPRTQHDATQNIHLTLTYSPLDANTYLTETSSPAAGANTLFLGTTRDTFEGRSVSQLSYTTYPPLVLKTLTAIAEAAVTKHQLKGVSIAHRLGVVPIGEASIAIAVSAGHRAAAWKAGEEILEACKERAEIWKREEFVDGGMEWRANADRDAEGNLIRKDGS